MKHTPGPWSVIDRVSIRIGECIFGCQIWGKFRVCSTERHNVGEEQERANARLIAAAPELLEACKAVIAIIEETPYVYHVELENILLPVIAKAEGRQ